MIYIVFINIEGKEDTMQEYKIQIHSAKKETLTDALLMLDDDRLKDIACDIAVKQKVIKNTRKERVKHKTVFNNVAKEQLVNYIACCKLFKWKVKIF
jgi:hypothetical protein